MVTIKLQIYFLIVTPVAVPIHIPKKAVIVTNPNPIPSQPPTPTILYTITTKQIRLNTEEIKNKDFFETLRDTIKITIANAIPKSNIGVHPSSINTSILSHLSRSEEHTSELQS